MYCFEPPRSLSNSSESANEDHFEINNSTDLKLLETDAEGFAVVEAQTFVDSIGDFLVGAGIAFAFCGLVVVTYLLVSTRRKRLTRRYSVSQVVPFSCSVQLFRSVVPFSCSVQLFRFISMLHFHLWLASAIAVFALHSF
jgi:hypothetical protein